MKDKLNVLWTSGDPVTAEKMVMMYTTNSMLHGWWKQVDVLIWGGASKLLSENELIQEKLKMAQHTGVNFIACKGCTDQLGISDQFLEMGIDVKYTGVLLTDYIKGDEKFITI